MAVVLPRRCFQLPVITYRERRREEEEIYRTHKKLQPGLGVSLCSASKDANTIWLARPAVGSQKVVHRFYFKASSERVERE